MLFCISWRMFCSIHSTKKDSKARKWLCEKRSVEDNENEDGDHGGDHDGSGVDETTVPLLFEQNNNRLSGSTITHNYSAL